MLAPLVDLLTGSACAGCGDPGRLLCAACAGTLRGIAGPVRPTPVPARGWPGAGRRGSTPTCCAPWCSATRSTPSWVCAARSASCSPVRWPGWPGRPSRRCRWSWCRCRRGPRRCGPAATTRRTPSRRQRRATLRVRGYDARVARLLRVGRVQDQAGLDASARAANLAGSMHCPSGLAPQAGPTSSAGLRGGLRRRPHDRGDRPRGAAGAGVQRPHGARHRRGRRDPTPVGGTIRTIAGPFRWERLASVYGVRPGPWLRRGDECVPSASRCQSQAKRST